MGGCRGTLFAPRCWVFEGRVRYVLLAAHCFPWASRSTPAHPCRSGEWVLGEILTRACYFPVCLMVLPSLSLLPPFLLSLPSAQHLLAPPCLLASLESASASPCVWKCPQRPRRFRATPWSCAASPAWRGRRWRPPRWWNGSTGQRAVKISLYVWLLTLVFAGLCHFAPGSRQSGGMTIWQTLAPSLQRETAPLQITDSFSVAQPLRKGGRPASSEHSWL